MARKSLIAPGSFLPEDGSAGTVQPSILETIIRKDGQKFGRLKDEVKKDDAGESEKEVTNVTTLQPSKEDTSEQSNDSSNEEALEGTQKGTGERYIYQTDHVTNDTIETSVKNTSRKDTKPSSVPTESATHLSPTSITSAETERVARLERGLGIAREDEKSDKIAVMTIRVPERLGAYMDRYVARIQQVHPKSRYRKQDAVAEAFAAFFADHLMPPEPVEEI